MQIGYHYNEPFHFSDKNRRQHCYVDGKTGTGKSALFANMLFNDLAEKRPVILFDPHGNLAEKTISLIPNERLADLAYINLADTERPFTLNLLANIPEREQPKHAEDLVAAFVHVFGKEAVADRSQQLLRNSLRLAMDVNGTLLTVVKILRQEDFRKATIKRARDQMVRSYWYDEFEAYTRSMREAVRAPILNKLDGILSPALRNMLAQQTCAINFRTQMDERKILIVNLATGTVGERPAQFFGALLITTIMNAAIGRAESAPTCYLYTDEFQTYTTTAFARILSETRKYGLALTLGSQTLQSLTDEVRVSILGNVGTLIAFRTGYDDAVILKDEIGLDSAQRITTLADFNTIGTYLQNGTTSGPIFLKMLPPPKSRCDPAGPIKNSRIRFGAPREEVERKINDFLKATKSRKFKKLVPISE